MRSDMDYTDKLTPFDGPLTSTRNPTPLSRLCEGLVKTFVTYRAMSAKVNVEATGYSLDDLYQGLYSITRRKSIHPLVQVHKQDGELILIKKGNEIE